MKKVMIVGGGFAGLSCARKLMSFGKDISVTIIDQRNESQFLPLLPDIVSERISPKGVSFSFELLKKEGINFILKKVVKVDFLAKKIICADTENIDYDYIVLCAGTKTNFYDNESIEKSAYKFNTALDAKAVKEALADQDILNIIISGGGYTGVELATSAARYCNHHKLIKRVILLERQHEILPGLPSWIREYAMDNLKLMSVVVKTGKCVVSATQNTVSLSDDIIYDKAILVWVAGVQALDIDLGSFVKRGAQNRVSVDESMQIAGSAYCIGDMAGFIDARYIARMGVQSATDQAMVCAQNIINSIENRPLVQYIPVDLGFILPMANDRSCGVIFAKWKLKGVFAQLAHYCMCIFRSWSFRMRVSVFWAMFR